LRAGTRRADALCDHVDLFFQAASCRPDQRPVPGRLRNFPLSGGVHARARFFSGTAGAGPEHGTVAVPAHDRHRRGDLRDQCKTIVPFTETLTTTLPPSSGALSSPALAAMRIMGMGCGTGGTAPVPFRSSCSM